MKPALQLALRSAVLTALISLGQGPAHAAEFYLVVSASSPQRALTQREAVDLYMGRSRGFANGDLALLFDLPRDHPQRIAFYKSLTGMDAAQVNSYWARLMFAGQRMPPQPLPDEAAMADIVKRNPSALGWLAQEPTDKALHVLLVIKATP